jgi:hypothetical protein
LTVAVRLTLFVWKGSGCYELRYWGAVPPKTHRQIVELIAMTERAGLKVTEEMVNGWLDGLETSRISCEIGQRP